MSKNTNPTPSATPHPRESGAGVVRVIDNAAIRDWRRGEVARKKEVRKKQARQQKQQEQRRAERENREQLKFARGYIARQDRTPLSQQVLTPQDLPVLLQNQATQAELDVKEE